MVRRAGKGCAGMGCVSLDVLRERCAVLAVGTLRLPRAAPWPARQSPCEGTGSGRRGSGAVLWRAAQQELFGARSAAPAALPPRESPRSRTRARRAWIQRGSGARTQGHGRCGGGPDPEGGRGPLRDAKQLYGTEACSRRVNRVVIRNRTRLSLSIYLPTPGGPTRDGASRERRLR